MLACVFGQRKTSSPVIAKVALTQNGLNELWTSVPSVISIGNSIS